MNKECEKAMTVMHYGVFKKSTGELLAETGGPGYLAEKMMSDMETIVSKLSKYNIDGEVKPFTRRLKWTCGNCENIFDLPPHRRCPTCSVYEVHSFWVIEKVPDAVAEVKEAQESETQAPAVPVDHPETGNERLRKLLREAWYIMDFHKGTCPMDIPRNFSGMNEHLAMYRDVLEQLEEFKGDINWLQHSQEMFDRMKK